MEVLTGNQIREAFINFFRDKHEHTVVQSSSLIPNNPTVLLTTAGMLQFFLAGNDVHGKFLEILQV